MQGDLFKSTNPKPLAEDLRPGAFSGFIGQEDTVKRVTALTSGKRMPSLLFYGPPGCGKSTLSLLIARKSRLGFVRMSAPEASVSAMREATAKHPMLVLDEIHRFSKAQQDFFLPIVERGELTLIATTTENPSFCVTPQLLSRMHALRMKALCRDDLLKIAENGAKKEGVVLSPEVADFMCGKSGGDARTLLSLVELFSTLPEKERTVEGFSAILPEMIGRHNEDTHYELASALIKSIRGSDPDAAVYWLAALIHSGEDPAFISRRLVISASEDIGLADPAAMTVALSCLKTVQEIGMPEGRIPLAETAIYLARAPKSNDSYMAINRALSYISANGVAPVPLHLRNAPTALHKAEGFHKGYLYPHDYPGNWVEQQYLPDGVEEKFYTPKH